MRCPRCKQEISERSNDCPNCGKSLAELWDSQDASPYNQDIEKHSSGAGINLGDTGMIKDSTFHSETHIDSHDNIGAPAVGGNLNINLGEDRSRATKTGEECPICGKLAIDNYFRCKKCGVNFICLDHMVREHFVCLRCAPKTASEPHAETQDKSEKRTLIGVGEPKQKPETLEPEMAATATGRKSERAETRTVSQTSEPGGRETPPVLPAVAVRDGKEVLKAGKNSLPLVIVAVATVVMAAGVYFFAQSRDMPSKPAATSKLSMTEEQPHTEHQEQSGVNVTKPPQSSEIKVSRKSAREQDQAPAAVAKEIVPVQGTSDMSVTVKQDETAFVPPKQSLIISSGGQACVSDGITRQEAEQAAAVHARDNARTDALRYLENTIRMGNVQVKKELATAYSNASSRVIQDLGGSWFRDPSGRDCYRAKLLCEVMPDYSIMQRVDEHTMLAADPSAPLSVQVWTEKRQFTHGEKITIYLKGNKPFYAKVVYRDAAGNAVQLLPNPYRRDNYFNGGTIYRIPSGEDQFELEVVPPFGTEDIVVYASTSELGEITVAPAGGVYEVRTDYEDIGIRTRGIALRKKMQDITLTNSAEFSETRVSIQTVN